MRPRTATLPTRKVGAPVSGALKEALISIRLSLTVGSRWRTLPASHRAPGATAVCATLSAETPMPNAAAEEVRRKSRRLMLMGPPDMNRAARSPAQRTHYTRDTRALLLYSCLAVRPTCPDGRMVG